MSTGGESGRVFLWLIVPLGLLTVTIALLYTVFGTVVPPDQIGVRRNYFSFGFLHEGYEPVGLRPGLHLKFPGISEIMLLPRTFQIVNLTEEKQAGDLNLSTIEVPTTDGSKVNTDVTLLVRLFEAPGEILVPTVQKAKESIDELEPAEGKVHRPEPKAAPAPPVRHGGPSDLITTYREKPLGQLERVAQVAQDLIRSEMSQLSTTDFYDPKLRETAALKAQDEINSKVNPRGVDIWSTLVRRYTYADAEIDQRIFQKNLQFQTEKYRAAATKFAEAEAAIKKTEAHWQAKVRDIEVEAEAYQLRAESEARLYEETKIAEGQQLLKSKQAEVISAQNQLLAKMPGAEVYLAREMVPLLSTLSGGIVSGLDPYDIDAWVTRLTGTAAATRAEAAKHAETQRQGQQGAAQ